MVKFIGGFHSDKVSGTFNDLITYQRSGRGYKKVVPRDVRSASQLTIRGYNKYGSRSWRHVMESEKDGWNIFAKYRSLPGYQVFLSMYIKARIVLKLPYYDAGETDLMCVQYGQKAYGTFKYREIITY